MCAKISVSVAVILVTAILGYGVEMKGTDYKIPEQENYTTPVQENYTTPVQENYTSPVQENYMAPVQENYMAPVQENYMAPVQENYTMPAQENYTPVQENYTTPAQENYATPVQADCGTQSIQCICGIGKTQKIITVTQKLFRNNSTGSNETECTGLSDPYQTCANYSCFLAPNQTTTTSPAFGSPKMKRGIVELFYSQEFTIPRGGSHRFARQSEPCFVPSLKNAEIKCWKWPNWMNCDIKCIYGYALQEKKETVSSININCRNTENVWKPHGFQDCQPFVNCKARLIKPGDLKCKEPISAPPYCEISCLDYDQYEATSKQKYECLDDSFARTLPHCAVLKEVELVKKPK